MLASSARLALLCARTGDGSNASGGEMMHPASRQAPNAPSFRAPFQGEDYGTRERPVAHSRATGCWAATTRRPSRAGKPRRGRPASPRFPIRTSGYAPPDVTRAAGQHRLSRRAVRRWPSRVTARSRGVRVRPTAGQPRPTPLASRGPRIRGRGTRTRSRAQPLARRELLSVAGASASRLRRRFVREEGISW